MLNIGCTTRSFGGMRVADTAARMREIGFQCTELCFVQEDLPGWAYNGIGPLEDYTVARVKEAVQIFRDNGVEVVSLGMFTDLRNPDAAVQEKTMDYVRRYIEFAAESGVKYIASECGFTPGKRGLSADTYEEDYDRLRTFVGKVCTAAEQSGVHLALEACVLDVIPSPRRLKTLIEELKASDRVHLGAMLDPANFIAAEDEEGMFRHLRDDIYYFHGKDRKINATYGINLGDGDIDWVKFMELYIRHTDGTPFILEYCKNDNCAEIYARALAYYEAASRRVNER